MLCTTVNSLKYFRTTMVVFMGGNGEEGGLLEPWGRHQAQQSWFMSKTFLYDFACKAVGMNE